MFGPVDIYLPVKVNISFRSLKDSTGGGITANMVLRRLHSCMNCTSSTCSHIQFRSFPVYLRTYGIAYPIRSQPALPVLGKIFADHTFIQDEM
jgi:hypothetical protein